MAHGVVDDKIPFTFGQNNFKALKTLDKQFIAVEGAGHFDLHEKGGAAYWAKMTDFILKNAADTEGVKNINVNPTFAIHLTVYTLKQDYLTKNIKS